MTFRFLDYSLDAERREISRNGARISVEPQVFDLLLYLIRNRDRVVSRDDLIAAIWKGRIVSDAAISSRIRDARAAIGDNGRDQVAIKTLHGRGFRFVADIAMSEASETEPPSPREAPARSLKQDVRYFRSFDGTQIAYSELGDGDTVILKTANWMSHLDYDLESPIWRHWIEALSDGNRLIRYDQRANGLSDWNVANVAFSSCVRDLECLVDELGLEKVVLFGISQGAAVAVDFAVRYPDKVDKIILYGGFVQGWRFSADENVVAQHIAMNALMRTGWGQDSHEFRQVFTSRFMPEASAQHWAWFNDLQKKSVSPHMAGELHEMFGTIDVADRLQNVRSPTLVLHARGDVEIPVSCGRHFASGIPGARFVSLDSRNHILLEDEPAFADFVEAVRSFLNE